MKKPFLVANSRQDNAPETLKLELTKLFIARKFVTHSLLYLEGNTWYIFDKGLDDVLSDPNITDYYNRLNSGSLGFVDVTPPNPPEMSIELFLSNSDAEKRKNIYYRWLVTQPNDFPYYGDSKGFEAVKEQYRTTREVVYERLNTMFKD